MRSVVILGAGFGGLTLAAELDPLAKAGKARVTLVDKSPHFSMGFSLQWAMAGRRSPEEGQRAYAARLMQHVKFVHDEILLIDTTRRMVKTRSLTLAYDDLIVALGAELVPEIIPGLAEGGYSLCDLRSVLQLKAALESIEKGTVMVAISSLPFKCPPAPYEYALLMDEVLRRRGVRNEIHILLTTPEPQPMPVAGKGVGDAVKSLLAEHKIEFLPGHKPVSVDFAGREIEYENGSKIAYDVLGAMAPHRAPRILKELVDASGFVPADLGTFKTAVPNVYAVGDAASIKLPDGKPHPKAGSFAESQAKALAGNLIALVEGKEPATRYAGQGTCFVETGQNMAAPAAANLLGPEGPRITLNPPSEGGLEGKRQFERERFAKWFGG
jgi:sulfide:quinone oxidoreductase